MTENLDRLARFLRDLAQARHIGGMPTHDLERNLNGIGQSFGVRVEWFAVLTDVDKRQDVKEYYFYLDATPSHSYLRYL